MASVIKVLPTVDGMVVRARTIALVNTFDTSGTAITTLPYECEYLVVLDLAQRVGLNKIQALALAALTSTSVAPVSPTLATVSYVNASGSTVTSASIGPIPSTPVFNVVPIPGIVLAASTAFDSAMTNEDVELATAQANKLSQGINQYQTTVQENINQFNKDLEKFKSEVQRVIEQANILSQKAQTDAKLATDVAMQNAIQTAQAIMSNNASLLQKYQADVGKYAQLVQSEVGIYQVNQARINIERDRLLALVNSFKNEYNEKLLTEFGIDLRSKEK